MFWRELGNTDTTINLLYSVPVRWAGSSRVYSLVCGVSRQDRFSFRLYSPCIRVVTMSRKIEGRLVWRVYLRHSGGTPPATPLPGPICRPDPTSSRPPPGISPLPKKQPLRTPDLDRKLSLLAKWPPALVYHSRAANPALRATRRSAAATMRSQPACGALIGESSAITPNGRDPGSYGCRHAPPRNPHRKKSPLRRRLAGFSPLGR